MDFQFFNAFKLSKDSFQLCSGVYGIFGELYFPYKGNKGPNWGPHTVRTNAALENMK